MKSASVEDLARLKWRVDKKKWSRDDDEAE